MVETTFFAGAEAAAKTGKGTKIVSLCLSGKIRKQNRKTTITVIQQERAQILD